MRRQACTLTHAFARTPKNEKAPNGKNRKGEVLNSRQERFFHRRNCYIATRSNHCEKARSTMLKAPPQKGTTHSARKGCTYIVEHHPAPSGRNISHRRITPLSGYKLRSRVAENRQIRMSAGTTAAALQRRSRPCSQLNQKNSQKRLRSGATGLKTFLQLNTQVPLARKNRLKMHYRPTFRRVEDEENKKSDSTTELHRNQQ